MSRQKALDWARTFQILGGLIGLCTIILALVAMFRDDGWEMVWWGLVTSWLVQRDEHHWRNLAERRQPKRRPLDPPPRYDDVYREGMATLDAEDTIEL